LERVARLVAGLGIFLYILGLLNINGYLLSFGVTDFSILRTRFIYTGALIVASALLCGLPLILRPIRREFKPGLKKDFDKIARKEAQNTGFRRWKHRATRIMWRLIVAIVWSILALLVWVAPMGVIYLLYLNQFSVSDIGLVTSKPGDVTPTIARMTAAVMLYGVGLFNAWFILRNVRRGKKEAIKARMNGTPRAFAFDTGMSVAVTFAITALYCLIFMTMVYPVVPQQYGGGRPQQVSLLFKEDALHGLQQIKVPLEPSARQVSAPVDLVHEADDIYVVRLPDERVVRIDKDLVSAVVVER
jgi:hypothetical protein